MSGIAFADNDRPIQIGQLPTKAQTFLSTYFKSSKVALAKQETDLFSKSYDVIFTTGEKVEFDKSGDWTEVSCKGQRSSFSDCSSGDQELRAEQLSRRPDPVYRA